MHPPVVTRDHLIPGIAHKGKCEVAVPHFVTGERFQFPGANVFWLPAFVFDQWGAVRQTVDGVADAVAGGFGNVDVDGFVF